MAQDLRFASMTRDSPVALTRFLIISLKPTAVVEFTTLVAVSNPNGANLQRLPVTMEQHSIAPINTEGLARALRSKASMSLAPTL